MMSSSSRENTARRIRSSNIPTAPPLTIPTPTTTSTLAHLTPLCPKNAASQKFCTCKKLAVIYTYEVLRVYTRVLVYSREPAAAAVEFEYISLANFQFTLDDILSFIHTTNRQVSEKLMLYQAVYQKYRSIYVYFLYLNPLIYRCEKIFSRVCENFSFPHYMYP